VNLILKLRFVDPLYWVFRWTCYSFIFSVLKRETENPKGAAEMLENVMLNTLKQTTVLYVSASMLIWAMPDLRSCLANPGNAAMAWGVAIGLVSAALIVWFAVTFGAVPARFVILGIAITWLMLFGLLLGVDLVLVFSWMTLPFRLAVIIQAMFGAMVLGALMYDTVDLLKCGVETAGYDFFRAATTWLNRNKAIEVPDAAA
jgi:apolipoprotein N-acyltransferase